MVKAVMNGLSYRQDAVDVSPTDDADAESERSGEPPGEPTPIAQPAAPREVEQPQGASSSRVQAERPQYFRMDTGPEIPETAEGTGLGERTGVRVERDVRQAGERQVAGAARHLP